MEPWVAFSIAVKAIDRELHRRVNEAMLQLGVTGPQSEALSVIGQAGRISLKDLGELLIAEGGHPSRLVDRLVEAGLVERRPAEDDRRRIELSLTPAGKRVEKRVSANRKALSDLGRELIPQREFDAALRVVLRLIKHTPHAELVEKRTELERQASGRRSKR